MRGNAACRLQIGAYFSVVCSDAPCQPGSVNVNPAASCSSTGSANRSPRQTSGEGMRLDLSAFQQTLGFLA